jgi:hypothetical protein
MRRVEFKFALKREKRGKARALVFDRIKALRILLKIIQIKNARRKLSLVTACSAAAAAALSINSKLFFMTHLTQTHASVTAGGGGARMKTHSLGYEIYILETNLQNGNLEHEK